VFRKKGYEFAWWKNFLTCFLALTLFFAFGHPAGAQTKKTNISLASGATGGVYYVMGGGLAALISKYVPGVDATAEVTAASVDNCKLVMAGKSDLAFSYTDVAYSAYAGLDRFKSAGKAGNVLRALAMLYPGYNHIVTLVGRGIQEAKDLKGKRVSTGPPGSGTEVMALKVLEALGIDPGKDIGRERLTMNESAGALKDGKIDAFFVNAGAPMSSVLDLASTPGMKMKLIPHDFLLDKINAKYGPIYFRLTIPQKAYPGMTQDVPVIAVGNVLFCHVKLDDKIAYSIAKTIFDHRDELILVHKEAENILLKNAATGSPLPFHPGAARYYKEKGVLK